MDRDLARLEQQLDSFDRSERREALLALRERAERGDIALPPPGSQVNLHCHTFFSYNPYGYSPSKLAWLARKAGLGAAGIVDFDVLDGLEEFREAGRLLDLKTCVGMETRVFVREFADEVINSPGEPGIAYQMGVGFPRSDLEGDARQFLLRFRTTAEQRNRELLGRVNDYLSPVVLDYRRDVLPLTPSGNATERHICLAYARKARSLFGDDQTLAAFWSEKLGVDAGSLDLPEGFDLQAAIRSRTMKKGGVGYVQPGEGAFPEMAELSRFVLEAGGIPTHCWLDGTSEGEARLEDLLAAAMGAGISAVSVIADLTYGRCEPEVKAKNMFRLAELAERLNLLLVSGTEMNTPGQAIVDSAGARELADLRPVFLKGAHVIYAHSVLQREAGLGCTSAWARRRFPGRAERNEFFQALGSRLQPSREQVLSGLDEEVSPQAILNKIALVESESV